MKVHITKKLLEQINRLYRDTFENEKRRSKFSLSFKLNERNPFNISDFFSPGWCLRCVSGCDGPLHPRLKAVRALKGLPYFTDSALKSSARTHSIIYSNLTMQGARGFLYVVRSERASSESFLKRICMIKRIVYFKSGHVFKHNGRWLILCAGLCFYKRSFFFGCFH